MSRTSKPPTIVAPTPEEDAAIIAAARNDPDAQPLTDAELAAMVAIRAMRGRPRAESKKVLVSVSYSPEVVDFFKSTGAGWQSRMDCVQRDYVARNSH
ncbi:BrnA antitoxin family protein [uncultured Thiodictyon sp.]|uniref:BrnA antitoxin family protein n=1 Tax=uncultured Thiodictyon sp. TaxID=1846217 RepID=UPI0025F614F4|nr:BrnA antitoxin family protein [uncultured Thiodictyon sp.]